ncbi:epidermal differentiation-specific protein-like [Mantella aurantiaca]
MNFIELFECRNFSGASVSIHQDDPDLRNVGFLKKAQSLKVSGDPWVVFSEQCYKGNFRCFKQGNYSSIPAFDDMICSVRHVKGGLYNPKITLYEDVNYKGREVPLGRPTDSLKSYGFDNMASSHKVESGAWILFKMEFYRGDQMVALSGDSNPNYDTSGWNDVTSSLRPLDAFEP